MSINKAFDTPAALAAQQRRYESKPGDPRRSGRALTTPAARELVVFDERPGRVEARVGAVTVGEIRINPAGGRIGYFFMLDLAQQPRTPQPAADLEKAKSAIAYRVRQWCEAAGLVLRRSQGDDR